MKTCPKCKSTDITETIWGLPANEPDETLQKKIDEGKIRFGGCCIDEHSKQFCCDRCLFEWGQP